MQRHPPEDLVKRIRSLSALLEPRPTNVLPKTALLRGIRAVLFDVYGTLVISASGDIGLAGEQNAARAFTEALDAARMQAPSGAGPAWLGQRIRAFHTKRKSAGIPYPEVDIREIWRQVLHTSGDTARLAVEYECRVNPVWPMPGLAEVLESLHRRPLVLGIVSNAQFYTPLMLQGFLGAALPDLGFAPECCAWSYRLLEAKPSTNIYRVAVEGLRRAHGIAPSEVLYVGNDMRNDIWPASLIGCHTALFAGDTRSLRLREGNPQCAGVVPDRVVTDLRQISDQILAIG